jgi:segregation and condensation protein A
MKMFEGPFDLLVYLIENAEMSIYDIEVFQITKQYFEYIDQMEELDVTVATEFMVLAATLIEIKAKMLLPRFNEEGEAVIEEDPRKELVTRLLEYKRFKKASEMLSFAEEENRRIYQKPQEDISRYTEQPDEFLSMDLSQFIQTFHVFLLKKQKMEEIRKEYQRVERERMTIDQRVRYIEEFFQTAGVTSLPFGKLMVKKDRYEAAITFVSILEMIKDHQVDVHQPQPFDEILVQKLSSQEREKRIALDEASKKIIGEMGA